METFAHAWHEPEPVLRFCGGGTCVDPRIGLASFGPLGAEGDKAPKIPVVRVGIIGSGKTVDMARQWLEVCRTYLKGPPTNAPLAHDFPGVSKQSPFRCEFLVDKAWEEIISDSKIRRITLMKRREDFGRRLDYGVRLFSDALRMLNGRTSKPDVVICALPQDIISYCVTGMDRFGRLRMGRLNALERAYERARETGQTSLSRFTPSLELIEAQESRETHYSNFRRALKAEAIHYPFKTQIAWPQTLTGGPNVQHTAIRAWNFCTALYYKAGGELWRPVDADPSVCFIGVSFFKNEGEPDVHTSMAQIFPFTGSGFVLRGDKVHVEPTKSPRLDEAAAQQLVERALREYESQLKQRPRRVVIHKTTRFSEEEQVGFMRALGGVEFKDLVALEETSYRFYRMGTYPVLRGTAIQLAPQNALLYTKGYTPFLKTYPGAGAPAPILLLEHFGDSPLRTIVSDMMSLTKMDWNSSDFCIRMPVTIAFSRKVGLVLSQMHDGDAKTRTDDYRYFM